MVDKLGLTRAVDITHGIKWSLCFCITVSDQKLDDKEAWSSGSAQSNVDTHIHIHAHIHMYRCLGST